MKHRPQRTCVGCRRTGDQAQLIRIAALSRESGVKPLLDPLRRAGGRGVYLCPNLDCFDKARRSRQFDRTLKQPVSHGLDECREALSAWIEANRSRLDSVESTA